MCEFCEGKTIKCTECDNNGALPTMLMVASMFGFMKYKDDKTNGIFLDKEDNMMGFDNSAGEYSVQYVKINYCPICGKNLNDKPMKPTDDFVTKICYLYGEAYDDRDEEKVPIGKRSNHKSLKEFQRELKEQGIELSLSKIIKVLVSGGKYSTERSRQIQRIYQDYINQGCPENEAAQLTAEDCEVSTATVCMHLPYKKTAYNLENKSGNAKRCDKYRESKK